MLISLTSSFSLAVMFGAFQSKFSRDWKEVQRLFAFAYKEIAYKLDKMRVKQQKWVT